MEKSDHLTLLDVPKEIVTGYIFALIAWDESEPMLLTSHWFRKMFLLSRTRVDSIHWGRKALKSTTLESWALIFTQSELLYHFGIPNWIDLNQLPKISIVDNKYKLV